jgi:hypothetical protein
VGARPPPEFESFGVTFPRKAPRFPAIILSKSHPPENPKPRANGSTPERVVKDFARRSPLEREGHPSSEWAGGRASGQTFCEKGYTPFDKSFDHSLPELPSQTLLASPAGGHQGPLGRVGAQPAQRPGSAAMASELGFAVAPVRVRVRVSLNIAREMLGFARLPDGLGAWNCPRA